MSERYLITGVQLGLLISLDEEIKRKQVVNEVMRKQFLGNSWLPSKRDTIDLRRALLNQKRWPNAKKR